MRLPPLSPRLIQAVRVGLFSFAVIFLMLLLIHQRAKINRYLLSNAITRTCGDMQFVAYDGLYATALGRNFSSSLKPYLERWQLSDNFVHSFTSINASQVVFVTYSSSNHFNESRKGIRSMRSQFKNKIVFYDLGLEKEQAAELNNVCNLEVRKFEFHRYPGFVSNLKGYNFKAIILAEVYAEFKHFWFVDTSIRFYNVTPHLNDFYASINSGTIETLALRHRASHSIFATTDPRMYAYLPMDESLAKSMVMFESGTMFIARSELSRQAVKWDVLCALTLDCLAPPTSKLQCSFPPNRYSKFANCHRYDQSAINIIVSSLLDRKGWNRDRTRDDVMIRFTGAYREDKDQEAIDIPCQ